MAATMGSHGRKRYKVGADGRTAYERLKGRKCEMAAIPIGESVWFKLLKDKEGRAGHRMESDWREGIWLGHARSTSEVIIGTTEGAVRAWAIKRKPEEERWSKEGVKEMQGTPSQPDPGRPGASIPIRVSIPACDDVPLDEVVPPREGEVPRRVYIRQRHLQKYGYTDECEGCKRMKAGRKDARPHTQRSAGKGSRRR